MEIRPLTNLTRLLAKRVVSTGVSRGVRSVVDAGMSFGSAIGRHRKADVSQRYPKPGVFWRVLAGTGPGMGKSRSTSLRLCADASHGLRPWILLQ